MKILYTATVLSHICQFHLPYLQMLQARGNEVHVAAHDNLAEKNGLQLQYCDRFTEVPFARSPKSPDNLRAYRELKVLLDREHYDVILCNTPMGGIVTRLAARKTRKQGTRVLYMAHGFHFYKGASKKNWLVFYPIEKFMSRFCDTVITINEEDYALAKAKFRHTQVEHIHGIGVRTDRYHPATSEERAEMRRAEGLAETDFAVLCTGELNKNKNQKTLISAAAKLKCRVPNLKVLLAGNGPLEAELRAQIDELGLADAVKLLGYRTDLEKVVPAMDVIVSCSRREGLPLNVIEAMLCKKPMVASANRGHNELVAEGETGYILSPEDAEGFADRIEALANDEALRERMGEAAYERALLYTVAAVQDKLRGILCPD